MNKSLKNLEDRAADLSFELPDGTPVVRLGLIITLYFKKGYTRETKSKIDECFARFYEEFQPLLKGMFYRKRKKLTDASFNKVREQISKTDSNDEFSWLLGSAAESTQADEYRLSMLNSFEIHGDQIRSHIKLVFPWSLLKQPGGAATYQEWLCYLSEKLEVEHGYGGLSSILPYDYHSYSPTEYELAQQYSGLEVDSMPHASSLELLEHIKGVNWYTVLGSTFVEQLGGESTIRHSLSGRGDIEILTYNNGLIIRAGEYPELGALEDGLPAAYVAVNKVVKPVRIPNPDQLHSYSPYGNCFEKDSTDRWYARFDQEATGSTSPSRIEAGQPCSKAGYWFSPAQANSRKYFKQGEIMPSFSGSAWGDTLWYWSDK
ncbi:DUF3396 domain-containing protein [Pseudomonas frederiksbergensis]|uniref:DUF3396 domain-containing protein n=1 Tax=Pseudomonas frederiksbergensis TaxID=104087 RepID=UPI000F46348A|nr:DUF3396 domain-containing protein [Pseudomonas frederiksbergensis]RON49542.1 hypothetical protein BK667_19905 [Pseudomonas frederiksbergensis]